MPWSERLPTGLYRAVWRDAAGRQRSKSGFTQAAAARRFAGEQEGRSRTGGASYVGRTMTWGKWCDTWTSLRRVENTSASSDAYRIEARLRPHWATTPLSRITTEDVQTWVNELARDPRLAPASVHKTYGLFRSSMAAAVRYKKLPTTPCVGIELPTIPPSDERFLTRDEFDAVAHYMSEPYRTAAIVLVGTGMRFGEMAGLHLHRIDWAARAIDVHETWDATRVKPYPKGRRKRRVPMADWVAEALAEQLDDERRAASACGQQHERGSQCRSALAVVGPLGAPLNARNMLRRHWSPAVERAGLPHARQHDLRHTTASWLAQAGMSMTEIAAVLGQREVSVTARYAHLGDTHMDLARRVLDRGSAEAAPSVPHEGRTVRDRRGHLRPVNPVVGDTGIEPVTPAV